MNLTEYIKLTSEKKITDAQVEEAFEIFAEDAKKNAELVSEFLYFSQLLIARDGSLSNHNIHRCAYSYITALEHKIPEDDIRIVYLYYTEAEYFGYLNSYRECLYYSQKVLDIENAGPMFKAGVLTVMLNILADAKDFDRMKNYTGMLKEFQDSGELDINVRILMNVSLLDIYCFTGDYGNYTAALSDLTKMSESPDMNDVSKSISEIHVLMSKFFFKETLDEMTDEEKTGEFRKLCKLLEKPLNGIDTLNIYLIPIFEAVKGIIPKNWFNMHVKKICDSCVNLIDKVAIYEYLVGTLRVSQEVYHEIYDEYLTVLRKFNEAKFDTKRASIAASFMEHAMQKQYIEAAMNDALTGMLSKNAFFSYVARITFTDRTVFFVADVNRLKYINDTFGHTEGDRALVTAGKRLKDCFGKQSRVYRYGGDEFYVIAELGEEDIGKAVEKLRSREKDKFIDDFSLEISIGYARSCDYPGEGYEYLIKAADKKMYLNKIDYYKTKYEVR